MKSLQQFLTESTNNLPSKIYCVISDISVKGTKDNEKVGVKSLTSDNIGDVFTANLKDNEYVSNYGSFELSNEEINSFEEFQIAELKCYAFDNESSAKKWAKRI